MTKPFATVVDIAADIASGKTSAVEVLGATPCAHHRARKRNSCIQFGDHRAGSCNRTTS